MAGGTVAETSDRAAGFAAYVRASQTQFPRGGMWVFAAWYAVMAAVLIWASTGPGAWRLRTFYVVALGLAALLLVLVFRANGARQFSADEHGLRLGNQMHARELAWSDVAEVRITPAGRGVRLDIVLGPAVPVAFRPAGRQAADLAFMFFVPVAGVRRNIPAVLVPRRDPARYQLPLLKVTAAEVRDQLSALAPGIPVQVCG